MKQDRILVLDLGSEENPRLAREIRALGVYSEIYPHDLSKEQLEAMPGVKGIILNGGPNRVVDGVEIDASNAVYLSGYPILCVDHKGEPAWPADQNERLRPLSLMPARRKPTGIWKISSPIKWRPFAPRSEIRKCCSR